VIADGNQANYDHQIHQFVFVYQKRAKEVLVGKIPFWCALD
jgi:hypothetical protein